MIDGYILLYFLKGLKRVCVCFSALFSLPFDNAANGFAGADPLPARTRVLLERFCIPLSSPPILNPD
jgi:hypothetical protein